MKNIKTFKKKTFLSKTFLKEVKDISSLLPQLFSSFKSKRISKEFSEKIMLSTTAVNGCIYCSWFHSKLALQSGIPQNEIDNLLKQEIGKDVGEYEKIALFYAQHYAETNKNPDKELTEKLYNFYGEKIAKDIILNIEIIYFGNLTGNTFDSLLKRLIGYKVPHESFWVETFFLAVILFSVYLFIYTLKILLGFLIV